MNAEIIAVGTELLLGNIVNTNAKYLSEELANLGISVYYQSVVGDNERRIVDTINLGLSRSDIIITTGGLGPTSDDITKETIAKCLDLPLVMHQGTKDRILAFFKKRNIEMPNTNLKQAYIPEGAVVLDNDNGTAPGLIIKKDKKMIIILPGPPSELKPIFEDYVAEELKSLNKGIIHSKTLKLCGIGESKVESLLEPILKNQTNPTIAPYAKEGEVHLRITAKTQSIDEAENLIKGLEDKVRQLLNAYIYTDDERTLEQTIIDELIHQNLTLSIAESCTGGLLSGRMVNCPGASAVYSEGYITYSNMAKKKLLSVSSNTLKEYGAVSEQTAKEMAIGAASASGADIGISITGLAGPSGGTKEKPVGLIYIGLFNNGQTTVKKCMFTGNRQKIRRRAVVEALILLRRGLTKDSQNFG